MSFSQFLQGASLLELHENQKRDVLGKYNNLIEAFDPSSGLVCPGGGSKAALVAPCGTTFQQTRYCTKPPTSGGGTPCINMPDGTNLYQGDQSTTCSAARACCAPMPWSQRAASPTNCVTAAAAEPGVACPTCAGTPTPLCQVLQTRTQLCNPFATSADRAVPLKKYTPCSQSSCCQWELGPASPCSAKCNRETSRGSPGTSTRTYRPKAGLDAYCKKSTAPSPVTVSCYGPEICGTCSAALGSDADGWPPNTNGACCTSPETMSAYLFADNYTPYGISNYFFPTFPFGWLRAYAQGKGTGTCGANPGSPSCVNSGTSTGRLFKRLLAEAGGVVNTWTKGATTGVPFLGPGGCSQATTASECAGDGMSFPYNANSADNTMKTLANWTCSGGPLNNGARGGEGCGCTFTPYKPS